LLDFDFVTGEPVVRFWPLADIAFCIAYVCF